MAAERRCRPKPRLLRALVRAAVAAAAPYGVPVTAKFRMGLHDGLLTHLVAGSVCEDEGVAFIAMHARTAQQHYAGDARWDAIGELKAHVTSIPVLGNGDIWVAADAVAMIAATGCDGVVVGRGVSGGHGCSATCSPCSPVGPSRPHQHWAM